MKNTGTSTLDTWELTWAFPDDQRITQVWNAQVTQTGRNVVAKPVNWNSTIPTGGSVNFGFNGTSSGQASDPTAFSLDGKACTVR